MSDGPLAFCFPQPPMNSLPSHAAPLPLPRVSVCDPVPQDCSELHRQDDLSRRPFSDSHQLQFLDKTRRASLLDDSPWKLSKTEGSESLGLTDGLIVNNCMDAGALGLNAVRLAGDLPGDLKTGFDMKQMLTDIPLNKLLTDNDFQIQESSDVSIDDYAALLQLCSKMKVLTEGKHVHAHVVKSGYDSHVFLANTLMEMYSNCESLRDAQRVFDKMCSRNVFSWTAIISAHVKQGEPENGICLFEKMQTAGIAPDKVLFLVVLKACTCLDSPEKGWEIHAQVIESGCESDSYVGSTLVNMYVKFGNLEDAQQAFNRISTPNIVSWNALCMGFAQEGLASEAFRLCEKMREEGLDPDEITFVSILKACTNLEDLSRGKQVHAQIIEKGLEFDPFIESSLIDMYSKCGNIQRASEMFSKVGKVNVVLWTTMIAGYTQNALWEDALMLFWKMQMENVQPNEITFAIVLTACTGLTSVEIGREVHANIIENGLGTSVFVGNTLVDMYAKCGCVEDAREVFDMLESRDVVTWNSMLAGYAQKGLGLEALKLFEKMQEDGVKPVEITFVSVLKACACLSALEEGRLLHLHVIENGLETDVFVASTLVDMYAKCGHMEDSRHVFDSMHERDVVSWNAIILGYVLQGPSEEALSLHKTMQQEGFHPDKLTFVNVLKACGSLASLERGKEVYAQIKAKELNTDALVQRALLDMFVKCGSLDYAEEVFSSMCERDVAAWNAMITACAEKGMGRKTISLFERMRREGVAPNEETFVSVLNGCSRAGLVEEASHFFHSLTKVYGIRPNVKHYACMIDLLSRTGHLAEAVSLIQSMPFGLNKHNWLTVLRACRSFNYGDSAKHNVEQALEFHLQDASVPLLHHMPLHHALPRA